MDELERPTKYEGYSPMYIFWGSISAGGFSLSSVFFALSSVNGISNIYPTSLTFFAILMISTLIRFILNPQRYLDKSNWTYYDSSKGRVSLTKLLGPISVGLV